MNTNPSYNRNGANMKKQILRRLFLAVPSIALIFTIVLGMVGAGGVGFELNVAMRLFRYQEVSAIIIVIIFTVACIDKTSSEIRSGII
ncbi:MAG: hypothetical protein P4L49_11825 [Desulfosporosinus sp.]|nr:hypothetical protein [Desulfosporosinus sp.]